MVYKKKIRAAMERAMGGLPPMTGALTVTMTFNMPRPKSRKKATHHVVKPDATNLAKAIEDTANTILWEDDSAITTLTIVKRYCDGEPSVVVFVEPAT
jgi:Holliday junction resolvase RusA-like endonuclease